MPGAAGCCPGGIAGRGRPRRPRHPPEGATRAGADLAAERRNGSVHAPPTRDVRGSAALRDRLMQEIAETVDKEALAIWAKQAMPLKNQLTEGDAQAVEAA
jgi:hypothetical protein